LPNCNLEQLYKHIRNELTTHLNITGNINILDMKDMGNTANLEYAFKFQKEKIIFKAIAKKWALQAMDQKYSEKAKSRKRGGRRKSIQRRSKRNCKKSNKKKSNRRSNRKLNRKK